MCQWRGRYGDSGGPRLLQNIILNFLNSVSRFLRREGSRKRSPVELFISFSIIVTVMMLVFGWTLCTKLRVYAPEGLTVTPLSYGLSVSLLLFSPFYLET